MQFYASAVAADDKIFAVSRTSGVFVLAAKPTFELVSRNQFAEDASSFDATPAICDGQPNAVGSDECPAISHEGEEVTLEAAALPGHRLNFDAKRRLQFLDTAEEHVGLRAEGLRVKDLLEERDRDRTIIGAH